MTSSNVDLQRKFIMDDQKGYMITSIETIEFPSSEVATFHPYIMERIMQIPVKPRSGMNLELKVDNRGDKTMLVRSGDIVSEEVDVLYKRIVIMHLQPGERVHLKMRVEEGIGSQHPCFRRVEHVWIDGNELHVEVLKGYSEKDVLEDPYLP